MVSGSNNHRKEVAASNAFKPNANDQQFIDDLIFTGCANNGSKDNKKVVVSRAFIKRLQQGATAMNNGGISSPGPDSTSENMIN